MTKIQLLRYRYVMLKRSHFALKQYVTAYKGTWRNYKTHEVICGLGPMIWKSRNPTPIPTDHTLFWNLKLTGKYNLLLVSKHVMALCSDFLIYVGKNQTARERHYVIAETWPLYFWNQYNDGFQMSYNKDLAYASSIFVKLGGRPKNA